MNGIHEVTGSIPVWSTITLNIIASTVYSRCSQHRRPGLPACHRASSIGDSSHSERAAPLTIGLVQKMD